MSGTPWTTEILAEWISRIDDVKILDRWSQLIAKRIKAIENARWLDGQQLFEDLKGAPHKTPLYVGRGFINFAGYGNLTRAWLYSVRPRKRVVWICPTPRCVAREARLLDVTMLAQWQITRTDPDTRARAAVLL